MKCCQSPGNSLAGKTLGTFLTRNEAANFDTEIAYNKLALKEPVDNTYKARILGTTYKPNFDHQLFKDLNGDAALPAPGRYDLGDGYWTDKSTGAKQFSILMTFDALFAQWDRYNGSNVLYQIVGNSLHER